jgi:hypothetical protein
MSTSVRTGMLGTGFRRSLPRLPGGGELLGAASASVSRRCYYRRHRGLAAAGVPQHRGPARGVRGGAPAERPAARAPRRRRSRR